MKLYKTNQGIVVEVNNTFYLSPSRNWDEYINDDNIVHKVREELAGLSPDPNLQQIIDKHIEPPLQSQEIWACGVTYYRSKVGRQEESKQSGGSEFYARVYEAERPEIFFKSTAARAVGHNGKVNIRKDSTWDVPEPELTLMVTSSAKIIGYTVGNDMSSRSIEGENPLYLPQAKTYDRSAAVGPCIYIPDQPLSPDTLIRMQVLRNNSVEFEGEVAISQIKRKFEELVFFLFRETSFPHGCLVMTGTGIVPSSDFTLKEHDVVRITIDNIGTLINTVN